MLQESLDSPTFPKSSSEAQLRAVIESTYDEPTRLQAIDQLAALGTLSAADQLIEAFRRSVWRDTRQHLIRAIGTMSSARATQFLCNLVLDGDDVGLAMEAITVLGVNGGAAAGGFLLGLAGNPQAPLCREAFAALGNAPLFPCTHPLLRWVSQAEPGTLAEDLAQRAILTLAKQGVSQAWSPLVDLITNPQVADQALAKYLTAACVVNHADAISTLQQLPTRHRPWIDDLKELVLTTLHLQRRQPIEGALEAVLTAPDGRTQRWRIGQLCTFAPDDVRKAMRSLPRHGGPDIEAFVRSRIADGSTFLDDLAFLQNHQDTLSADALAFLCLSHCQAGRTDVLTDTLHATCRPRFRLALLANVYAPDAAQRLRTLWKLPLEGDHRAAWVDAVVQQAFLAPGSEQAEHRRSCAGTLERVLIETHDHTLHSQVVRGFGTLRWEAGPLLKRFAVILENSPETPLGAAVRSALSEIRTPPARELVLGHLAKFSAAEPPPAYDALIAVVAAQHGEEEIAALADAPAPTTPTGVAAMLQVLATTHAPRHHDFIAQCLESGNYETKLLAIAAGAKNLGLRLQEALFEYIFHENDCLAERALDSLCVGGDAAVHHDLLDAVEGLTPARALKLLRCIKVHSGSDYRPMLVLIGQMLRAPEGVWNNRGVMAAGQRLRKLIEANMNRTVVEAGANRATAHDIATVEGFLERRLVAYAAYSDTVKSVLINAEITYQNSALFNWRVDKSTVVVEYVKAIDILMQEKVFPQLFGRYRSQALAAMQSRVVQLSLDDATIHSSRRIQDLNCGSHFSTDDFPGHKINALADIIVSGRIAADPYRHIDGLRSWALLLLIFARTFASNRVEITPLLKLQNSDNLVICEIAERMCVLQEARNQAAHRGTMLEYVELDAIRQCSIDILNALSLVFGPEAGSQSAGVHS